MKKVLIATGIAALAFASIASAQSYSFTGNLTVGSTGPAVVALQTMLISGGINIASIQSGAAAKGYFGSQTKMAVQAYQTARGIPSTGFVGPLTRAALNGGVASTGTACPTGYSCTPTATSMTCPTGYVCTPASGTVVPPVVTTPGVISTPGVEGTLSASQSNAGLVSTVYEGDRMVAILGVELEAKNSDISIQRLKLRMDELTTGSDTKYYNKIFTKLYVTDGSTVLASSDLNSSTVVKDGSNYYITLAGFNSVIPKNSKKTLVIKADVYSNIDSTDFNDEVYQLGLATNGVRGIDGAGIDQYAGGSSDNSIARTTTIATSLAESATLKMSLNTNSPKKNDVIAAAGSNENELDKLTVLSFDLKAEKDSVKVTDLIVQVQKSGTGAATASTTAFLYEGTTELDSASISGVDSFVFSNFDQTIAKDATRTFTVKVDVRNANIGTAAFTAVASTTGVSIVSENTKGDSVTETGSATGYQIGVRNVGVEIALLQKTISASGTQTTGTTNSTSTLTANFAFSVKAVGGDVYLGTIASSSPFFATSTPSVGTKSFRIIVNGTENTTIGSNATSTSFTIPSSCTTAGQTNSCLLAENATVIIPVTFSIQGRKADSAALTSGLYSIGIRGLNWSGQSTTFMDGELDWMTVETSFPL